MNANRSFMPTERKKVLISNDFREVLIKQETSIIEQRIIVTILSSIKSEQSQLINVKQPDNSLLGKQLSFNDLYDGWANQGTVDFILPLKDLNPKRAMKNLSIKTALVNMTNINWLQLKDESINGYKAVPFILEPSWNRTHIYFKMDKAVMSHLMNMNPYFSLRKNLPYHVSSTNTLRFLMWILKYKKLGGLKMEYSKVLKEFSIHKDKYESRSKFERDFLNIIKADLDSYNDVSFNYGFDGQSYSFCLYHTDKSVGEHEKFISINDLQVDRSLKYLKKKRNLDESQIRVIRQLYQLRGYIDLAKEIKGKISPEIKGSDFIKSILALLEK